MLSTILNIDILNSYIIKIYCINSCGSLINNLILSLFCYFFQFKGEYRFLLKWKGYSEENNTWEPATNLYCVDMLDAYKKKFNLFPSLETVGNVRLPAQPKPKTVCPAHTKQKRIVRKFLDYKPAFSSKGVHHSSYKLKQYSNKRNYYIQKVLEWKQKSNKLIVSIDLATVKQGHHQHADLFNAATPSDHQVISTKASANATTVEHSLMCITHDHTYIISSSLHSMHSPSSDSSENVSKSSIVYRPLSPLGQRLVQSANSNSSPFKVEAIPLSSPQCLQSKDGESSSPVSTSSRSNETRDSETFALPTPRVNDDLKLYLSPSSSTDVDVCEVEDDGNSERLFLPDKKYSLMSDSKPQISNKHSPNLKSNFAGSNSPRWRNGPVPLPKSLSKRHWGTSELQTDAAKTKPFKKSIINKCRKREMGLVKPANPSSEIPLPHLVCSNGKKQVSIKPNGASVLINKINFSKRKLSIEHSTEYKEQLMNWQFELNRQRDGTDDFIYVENEIDRDPLPLNFNYICSNIYREGVPDPDNAEVNNSLCGCECFFLGRKCGPRSEYCCATMAGSKFAYTLAGKVRVPPGTPIYECNPKCTCPSGCSNRIVQLGRKIPLCIFRTNGRGWGVKTMQPIKSNTFVSEYVGEVITNEEAERRGEMCDTQGITYLFDLDFEDDNSAFTVDAANYGNVSHFFNHSVSCVQSVILSVSAIIMFIGGIFLGRSLCEIFFGLNYCN